jgi:hypothetical protein
MRLCVGLILLAFPLFGDEAARPSLNGTWLLDLEHSQIHSRVPAGVSWTIDQKDEQIHLVETGKLEVTCGTRGADCKTKEAGKPVTVSFWYNGGALVEMETEGKGEAVTKKKMLLSEDGNSLIVEVTHILPEGHGPEKYVLTKQH